MQKNETKALRVAQQTACLLAVADDEGCSIEVISTKTGLTLSTVSRIVRELSTPFWSGKGGILFEVKYSQKIKRSKEIYLTAEGKNIVSRSLS